MYEATHLFRERRCTETTALLQRLLRGTLPTAPAAPAQAGAAHRILGVVPTTGEAAGAAAPRNPAGMFGARGFAQALAERLGTRAQEAPVPDRDPVPEGAQFVARTYTGAGGSRGYKLFIPSTAADMELPLIVMLHGCTQSPDDFATGTGMNQLAEMQGCLVAYPGQTKSANAHKCWNWFNPADQFRDQGEPALIAGITRDIMGNHAVDRRRVYVAGLSAGGAAAAVLGSAYPDIFAAVGVHSGLPCGAARDIPSAFAAMRDGAAVSPPGSNGGNRTVPTIVFHADKDATVHPRNGDHIIAQSGAGTGLQPTVTRGQVPGGRAYTRSVYADSNGRAMLEQWLVHGGGHAWSGGSAAGSYTDPLGPHASGEMLRFFLEHRLD